MGECDNLCCKIASENRILVPLVACSVQRRKLFPQDLFSRKDQDSIF